jgi:phage terminase large subunit-like protein
LTTSPSVALTGAQRPRVSSYPSFVSSAGQEACELAASAGLVLDDWQQHVLDVSLGERADGKWAAFEVGLVVGRQNGKGAILEARELAGLFLFGEKLILHSAHEFKTAAEAFRRVLSLVQNTPDLEKLVRQVRTSHGDEGIELKNGARLRFVARSTGSGRGFSGDVVILDEAYNLPAQAMGALLPTMAARPNPQVWYTSSAGTDDSEVLARVKDRGAAGSSPRLAYFEWSADPMAELDDEQAWAAANPGLGIRILPEFVEAERSALPEMEFARERLGIWADGRREGRIGSRSVSP